MGNPQTLNLYSYVENNPITGTDPDGHDGAFAEAVDSISEEANQVANEVAAEVQSKAVATAVGLRVIAGAAGAYLGAMLDPKPVGQSDADEKAATDNASKDRAAQNGGVDPQLGHARGADEERSQSDDAKDRARTNGGLIKGEDFSTSAKREIDARDGNKCQNCGRDVRSTQNKKGVPTPADQRQRHHITPKSQGGKGTAANGKTLCPDCHKEEHRKIREKKTN